MGKTVKWVCGRKINSFNPFEGLKPTLVVLYQTEVELNEGDDTALLLS